jgi:hypothetical protein
MKKLSKVISLEIPPGPSIDALTIPANDKEHCSNRRRVFKGNSTLTNELVIAKTVVFEA